MKNLATCIEGWVKALSRAGYILADGCSFCCPSWFAPRSSCGRSSTSPCRGSTNTVATRSPLPRPSGSPMLSTKDRISGSTSLVRRLPRGMRIASSLVAHLSLLFVAAFFAKYAVLLALESWTWNPSPTRRSGPRCSFRRQSGRGACACSPWPLPYDWRDASDFSQETMARAGPDARFQGRRRGRNPSRAAQYRGQKEMSFVLIFGGGLLVLLFIGLHVASAITLLAFGSDALVLDGMLTSTIASIAWDRMNEFALIAIPLFVLLGEILLRAGIADRMYNALASWMEALPRRPAAHQHHRQRHFRGDVGFQRRHGGDHRHGRHPDPGKARLRPAHDLRIAGRRRHPGGADPAQHPDDRLRRAGRRVGGQAVHRRDDPRHRADPADVADHHGHVALVRVQIPARRKKRPCCGASPCWARWCRRP